MSDDLTKAVEAGFLVSCEGFGLDPNGPEIDKPQSLVGFRRVIEAARPHMPETKALERVRALCEAQGDDSYVMVHALRAILRAIEDGTPDHDERNET